MKHKLSPLFIYNLYICSIKDVTHLKLETKNKNLYCNQCKKTDKWSRFSFRQLNFCQTRVTKDTESHLTYLYQNNPQRSNSSMSQAWQLCSSPTCPPFFYASLSLSTSLSLPCFYLITLVSFHALTSVSVSCHTIRHSIPLYFLPAAFHVLSEMLETRHWLLCTMALFVYLFADSPFAMFSKTALDTRRLKILCSQRLLCFCTDLSITEGFVFVGCK